MANSTNYSPRASIAANDVKRSARMSIRVIGADDLLDSRTLAAENRQTAAFEKRKHAARAAVEWAWTHSPSDWMRKIRQTFK